jgi:hypothetical protein
LAELAPAVEVEKEREDAGRADAERDEVGRDLVVVDWREEGRRSIGVVEEGKNQTR